MPQSAAFPGDAHKLQLLFRCAAAQMQIHTAQEQAILILLKCGLTDLEWIRKPAETSCVGFDSTFPVEQKQESEMNLTGSLRLQEV